MAYDLSEDTPTNPLQAPTIGDVVNTRLGRRETIKGMLAVTALSATALAATGFAGLLATTSSEALAAEATFTFDEISAGIRCRGLDPLGRSGIAGRARFRPDESDRSVPGTAVWLQLRFH